MEGRSSGVIDVLMHMLVHMAGKRKEKEKGRGKGREKREKDNKTQHVIYDH